MTQAREGSSPLWAVTSYFNPAGYRLRWDNFRLFRERLHLPLVAVELSFDGRFELRPGDAEILIQIQGGDVMWQKERLLNLGIQALPSECTQIAILDCDVVFVRPDWADLLSRKLDDVAVVQPFSTVHYIPRGMSPDAAEALAGDFTRPSASALIARGETTKTVFGNFKGRYPGTPATGHAVAARRDLLDDHGMYDACIVGGGDRALLAGATGGFEELAEAYAMSASQRMHYLAWAQPLRQAADGRIAATEGDLIHLWHGEMSDRRSPQRHLDLAAFGFDPNHDITLDACGCWRWNTPKPAMHAYLREYFAARREDGPQGDDEAGRHPASCGQAAERRLVAA